MKSGYMSKKSNLRKFLESTVRVDRKYHEKAENVLLENTLIDKKNKEFLKESIELIVNQEPNSIEVTEKHYAETEVGRICYQNSIIEFDIKSNEYQLQKDVDKLRDKKVLISEHSLLLDFINDLFISKIPDEKHLDLQRLKEKKARRFYNMFLTWKINQTSYNEMINSFVRHWNILKKKNEDTIIYVGKWGELTRVNPITGLEGHRKLWIDISKKDKTQLINLAIVRIKEEQDYLENQLMKFIEVLYDLELIENSLYSQLKYGTDNKEIITIVKNGIGLQTAKLLISKYMKYLKIDTLNSTLDVNSKIVAAMKHNGENDIVAFEVAYSMGLSF